MVRKDLIYGIEVLSLIIYFLLSLFSVVFQPINLILGFIIFFIYPGINFLNLIRKNYSLSYKLGFGVMFSLAIENVLFFIGYILLYNFNSYPDINTTGFIFNSFFLVITVILINILLIALNLANIYKKDNNPVPIKCKSLIRTFRDKIDLKKSLIIFFFLISLILICISTYFSYFPEESSYTLNRADYRDDFTFFFRVSPWFYIFLVISIILFVYIIFQIENKYIILILVSFFLYVLWILPYLQIKSYFSHDTHLLMRAYNIYVEEGISVFNDYRFVIPNFDTLRYSTGLLTAILMTNSCSVSIDFALWYIFPLFFTFLPFIFYSFIEQNSEGRKRNAVLLSVGLVFVLFTPQILKYGHATGTGLLGTIIMFILIFEFMNIIKKENISLFDILLVIFLYIFLAITHTEEGLYFIVFVLLFSLYYLFIEMQYPQIKEEFKLITSQKHNESLKLSEEIDYKLKFIKNREKLFKVSVLSLLLLLIFYVANEFFGYMYFYLDNIFGRIPFLQFFNDLYYSSRTRFPFLLRGTLNLSISLIIFCIFAIVIYFLIGYFLFLKKSKFSVSFNKKILFFIRKLSKYIKKLFSSSKFQKILVVFLYISLILVNIFVLGKIPLEMDTLFALIFTYSLSIIHIMFFIMGFRYLKLSNKNRMGYLLAMVATSMMFLLFVITGQFWFAIFVFHVRYLTFFTLYNFLIIQNNFFRKFIIENKKLSLALVAIIIFLGVFAGLRRLAL